MSPKTILKNKDFVLSSHDVRGNFSISAQLNSNCKIPMMEKAKRAKKGIHKHGIQWEPKGNC